MESNCDKSSSTQYSDFENIVDFCKTITRANQIVNDEYNGYTIVKTIEGNRCLKRKSVIAYCNCRLHLGFITPGIMKKHNCLRKECRYFKKVESTFWEDFEKAKSQKELIKQEKRRKKEAEKAYKSSQKKHIELIKILFEQLIGEMSYYNVHITKIEEYERKYRIFYVADDRRAIDRQMETYIIKSIKKSYKGMFSIRRMKNIDGANATWQEWLNRPNKSSD